MLACSISEQFALCRKLLKKTFLCCIPVDAGTLYRKQLNYIKLKFSYLIGIAFNKLQNVLTLMKSFHLVSDSALINLLNNFLEGKMAFLFEQLLIIPWPLREKNCFWEVAVTFHKILNYSSQETCWKVPFYFHSFFWPYPRVAINVCHLQHSQY